MIVPHPNPLITALVFAVSILLAGCSSYGSYSTSTDTSSPSEVTCDDVLASAIQRERTDDTSGEINSEMQWLSENCGVEYGIMTEYVSARSSTSLSGVESCEHWAQYIGDGAIRLLEEDGLCADGAGPAADEPAAIDAQPGGGIAWHEAVDYAGTAQRVCGPLAGGGNSYDDVFLNLGLDYPDPERFQIVVWDIGALEPIAGGSTLCTSGVITLYNGVAQIELYDPSVIEVYE